MSKRKSSHLEEKQKQLLINVDAFVKKNCKFTPTHSINPEILKYIWVLKAVLENDFILYANKALDLSEQLEKTGDREAASYLSILSHDVTQMIKLKGIENVWAEYKEEFD